jgi:MFS family permease
MRLAAYAAVSRYEIPAAVIISLAVQTIITLYAAGIPVLAPAIAADRGWDVTLIGLYPTIVCVVAFLICFQVPGLLARIGGMGLGLACIGVSAVGMLLVLSPYVVAVALAPVAIGCAAGAMNPASSQVLGPRTTPRTAGLIMSIKQTGVPLGGVVAGALVPALVLQSGWRLAAVELAVTGGVAVLLLLPTVRWLNGDAAGAPAAYRPLDPIKHLLSMRGMPTILLASVTFNAMQWCLRSFFTVYLVTHLRFSLVAAGVAFSTSQAAGMVGQIGWAAMSDRVSVHVVMAIIGVLMSVGAFLTASMTPEWSLGAVAVVAAIYGISAAGYIPVLLGEVARRAPAGKAGALTSGAQLFPFSGAIVGPLVFAGISATVNMPTAFIAAGACTLLGTVLLATPHRIFVSLFDSMPLGRAARKRASASSRAR